jgi:proline dehydrogenase
MKANFRLCKGIYRESPDIAYQDRDEIRRNYGLLLRVMMENGCYVGIATHDEYLVGKAFELISKNTLPRERYEFQMLLGVREQLRKSIVDAGHRLRVYVPYGDQWYAYSVRRLKENPQIAGYVLRALLTGNS